MADQSWQGKVKSGSEEMQKLAILKRINDHNEKNLLQLGIDMNALPNNISTIVKDFVDIQQMTGLHDLDLVNLEMWHLHRKNEVVNLESGDIKLLQRKVKNGTEEMEKMEKKINALNEAIDQFKQNNITDSKFDDKLQEIGSIISVAEKGIAETPSPPVQLDIDDLINQVNVVNAERESKRKNNTKMYPKW